MSSTKALSKQNMLLWSYSDKKDTRMGDKKKQFLSSGSCPRVQVSGVDTMLQQTARYSADSEGFLHQIWSVVKVANLTINWWPVSVAFSSLAGWNKSTVACKSWLCVVVCPSGVAIASRQDHLQANSADSASVTWPQPHSLYNALHRAVSTGPVSGPTFLLIVAARNYSTKIKNARPLSIMSRK